MPIKNYTTTVSANRSINEIQDALVAHGAVGCMFAYDDEGRISSLRFALNVKENIVNFSLPVEWKKFQEVLKQQGVKRWDDDDYCYRVAWRNLRDWVLAQMALYETQMVEMPQIFLPFANDASGETLYDKVLKQPNSFLLSGSDVRRNDTRGGV